MNKNLKPNYKEELPDGYRYAQLGEILDASRSGRIECFCGCTVVDDNGGFSIGTLSFCCTCGEQFDAEVLTIKDD